SEEHTSEVQSLTNLVCRLLLEKKKDGGLDQGRCAWGVACAECSGGGCTGCPGTPGVDRAAGRPGPTAASAMPLFFFFNETATTEIYTLSLPDALPISAHRARGRGVEGKTRASGSVERGGVRRSEEHTSELQSLTNLVCRLLLEKR